jgi:hypothetical protein
LGVFAPEGVRVASLPFVFADCFAKRFVHSLAQRLPFVLIAYRVACYEPFIPLTGESAGLWRRERDTFACAFRTDGPDTRINLVLPFAKQAFGFGRARVR